MVSIDVYIFLLSKISYCCKFKFVRVLFQVYHDSKNQSGETYPSSLTSDETFVVPDKFLRKFTNPRVLACLELILPGEMDALLELDEAMLSETVLGLYSLVPLVHASSLE